MTDRIVIVGAGECGARAAVALRERGFGGRLTLVGDEAVEPYERPPLSKEVLSSVEEPERSSVLGAGEIRELEINWLSGTRVERIDRGQQQVLLGDGRGLEYDRLLLATGARARRLGVVGGELGLTLRSFSEALALRCELVAGRHVVIVGGGFVGLEVAASARERGCTVTVLEVAERVMSRLVPGGIAEVLARRHQAAGVDVRCGACVQAVEQCPPGYRIALESGELITCDVLVVGVGAVPNVELASAAGLCIEDGIRVDETLATSDPSIYAAGDCCSFPHRVFGGRRLRLEAWSNALEQAAVVAGNLLGQCAPHEAIPWFWSDQYDLGVQIAGLPGLTVREVVRARPDGAVIVFGLDGGGRLVAASGIGQGSAVARDIRICQRLIAQRCAPDPLDLADPDVGLRPMLDASVGVM